MQVLERKMGNVAKTGATIVATSCPACILQLSHGTRTRGLDVEVVHVTQLLDRAMGASRSKAGEG
jgi:glycolate oxidase iron-sulfur subunit